MATTLFDTLLGGGTGKRNKAPTKGKNGIDTRIKFSLEPAPGADAFNQWKDAMKAVARLPHGIPPEFRRKVWIALADHYVFSSSFDWDKVTKFTFNEKSNPDDYDLGHQIVKDLHRTGCSGFSGQDNEEDRAMLKRVLLAYARWNKNVGYCQGFNVLAALILDVVQRSENNALKVMVLLVDSVLPDSYFANNLRALSVDMAVFRELLRAELPQLSAHLDRLQQTGTSYEPPVTNVFTMQWFLTLFATCLPQDVTLRLWDCILLDGSEILLRAALAIWSHLHLRIMSVHTADEFYSFMGELTQEMLEGRCIDSDDLIKKIYQLSWGSKVAELREKYTYNITPLTSSLRHDDGDDDIDDDEIISSIGCFPMMPSRGHARDTDNGVSGTSSVDFSKVGPGAYGVTPGQAAPSAMAVYLERMTLNMGDLRKQYRRLQERQTQAHVILAAARRQARGCYLQAPMHSSAIAVNHLFLGRKNNRLRQNTRQNNRRPITNSKNNRSTESLSSSVASVDSSHWGELCRMQLWEDGSTEQAGDTCKERTLLSMVRGSSVESNAVKMKNDSGVSNGQQENVVEKGKENGRTLEGKQSDEQLTIQSTNNTLLQTSPSRQPAAGGRHALTRLTYRSHKAELSVAPSPLKPFASAPLSKRRAQLGLQLGLYTPEVIASLAKPAPVTRRVAKS